MTLRSIKKTAVRNRAAMSPSRPKITASAVITTVDATAANTIQLTFDTRVMATKTPGFTAGAAGDETVNQSTQISDTVIEIRFSGDVQGTDLVVPDHDPGIRTVTGAFVPAGTYAIPTFP